MRRTRDIKYQGHLVLISDLCPLISSPHLLLVTAVTALVPVAVVPCLLIPVVLNVSSA